MKNLLKITALVMLLHAVTVVAQEQHQEGQQLEQQPPRAFERSPVALWLEEEGALSAHDPMYFVVGGADDGEDDITARFQLSFKYRVFDPETAVAQRFYAASKFHFAYTQTSLWNWTEDSAPFEDTTYRPSLFWQHLSSGQGIKPELWRVGLEHASNGQAGELSRSMNTLFVQPLWWTRLGGRELAIAPRFIAYLEKSDNPDIDDYYGNVELLVRYGSEEKWLLDFRLRGTSTNQESLEINLSYPFRQPFFYNAGGYFYMQYFQGNGENLLEYNLDKEPTLRFGFAIVR